MRFIKNMNSKRKRSWTSKQALQHIRSYWRKGIHLANLLRLINNNIPSSQPALSTTLYYQAYRVFCSSTNVQYIAKSDCKFCDCLSCVDFDDNTNHGTCTICGICFYIPVGNSTYSTDADFLICDLDKDLEELPLPVKGNESTQNPRS